MSASALIALQSIDQDRSSYVDPQGFLFHYEGGVYRLIAEEAAPMFSGMLSDGRLQNLVEKFGLVRTTATDKSLEGFESGLVVEHEKIWPLSYCVEWCPSMLQNAAKQTLSLCRELVESGQMLQDAYPWNVLFSGVEPVFVDLTSIKTYENRVIWPAHEQFDAFFTRPLVLSAEGKGRAARHLLFDNIAGIGLDEFYTLVSPRYRLSHPGMLLVRWLDRWLQKSATLKERARQIAEEGAGKVNRSLRLKFFDRLLERIRAFSFSKETDPWVRYYAEIDDSFDKKAKLDAIRSLLARLQPVTVLDLGCNTGVFSLEAAASGARVISVDSSESCIEMVHAKAKRERLAITPLISDVTAPTPPFGFMGEQYPGIWERVCCDVVMCLGLMHHLHISGRQSFERIAALLDKVTNRHLIFEFVAIDDANIPHLSKRRPIDYNLASVKQTLAAFFPAIEELGSDRATRTLLLCSK